jgi:protein-disulfide isomerase
MLAQYGSQIRYEVKHFPIYPNHRYSKEAAEAAECAADQGKFWEFEEMDYENQDDLSPAAISKWATDLGLDMDLFERCRKSDIKMAIVESSQQEGEKMGVNGTPTFFVNGQRVESTIQAIGAAIQEAASGATTRL